jgi:hypothetical protein
VKFSKPAVADRSTLDGRAVREATSGAPFSIRPWRGWTAKSVTDLTSARTHCSSGDVVDAAINDDETRTASRSDTRMKCGGIKRH